MELHWSKGTNLLTFYGLQTQPTHTGATHRWLVVLWQFAMFGSALAQGFLHHTPVTQQRLAQTFIIFIDTCVCKYTNVHIFITTVPRSLSSKTVGDVLPQKAYRPRIK